MFEKCATEMALAHNMILRGLNSIYQQAPWVEQRDAQDFLEYCKLWVQVITVHHNGEESDFFPYIESSVSLTLATDRAVSGTTSGDEINQLDFFFIPLF